MYAQMLRWANDGGAYWSGEEREEVSWVVVLGKLDDIVAV